MKCPHCDSELPLLSNICPVCRKPAFQNYTAVDAHSLSVAIDQKVTDIQKAASRSEGLKIKPFVPVFILVIAVGLAVAALKTGAALLWILATAFAIPGIIKLFKKPKDDGSQDYKEMRIEFDNGLGLVSRYFPGEKEMAKFSEGALAKVKAADKIVNGSRSKSLVVGLAIAAVELILVLLLALSLGNKAGDAAGVAKDGTEVSAEKIPADYEGKVAYYIGKAMPDAAVEAYVASEYNDEYKGGAQREALCRDLCYAGFAAEAEGFFFRYCSSRMQDTECASAIVSYYMSQGMLEEASSFVSRCSLRYPSDIKKLNKMINK